MDLVSKAKCGDKEAFIQLMEANKLAMYKIAKAIVKNDDDSADAIQETILACYKNIGTLKHSQYFKTWLTKILINKCNDIIKLNHNLVYTDIDETEECASQEQANDEKIAVKNCLNSLSEHDQLIMMLYYVDGFRIREIGKILNLNENTVKTQLSRGRERFKAVYCLQEGGY